jgi:hypothetical protein
MNKTDFTKPGGFLLDQDALDYLQSAYVEAITALSYKGSSAVPGVNVPMALYGMVNDPAANTISSGWIVYNGEIMPFTGGASVPVTGGNAIYIVITTTVTDLEFDDGTNQPVLISTAAALQELVDTTATDATHCQLSTLLYGNPQAYTVVNTSGSTDGTAVWDNQLQYRYDSYKKQLHIKGLITFIAGYPTAGNSLQSVTITTMGSNYGAGGTGFRAFVNTALTGKITNPAGDTVISGIDGMIGTHGEVILHLKPSPGLNNHGVFYYPVNINCIIPCD